MQNFELGTLVPWMLAVGPDGALYVSVDQQYEAASSYGNPSEYDETGAVLRIELLADGEQTALSDVQAAAAPWELGQWVSWRMQRECGGMPSCKLSDKVTGMHLARQMLRTTALVTGTLASVAPFVPAGSGGLKRPCGLCFDTAGFMYVTSLSDQVSRPATA